MSPEKPRIQAVNHIHALNFTLVCPLANYPAMCTAAGMAVGVASPCGKLEKFSGLAKLDSGLVQLDGMVGAERDLEDYMGIPDTNVNGCSLWQ